MCASAPTMSAPSTTLRLWPSTTQPSGSSAPRRWRSRNAKPRRCSRSWSKWPVWLRLRVRRRGATTPCLRADDPGGDRCSAAQEVCGRRRSPWRRRSHLARWRAGQHQHGHLRRWRAQAALGCVALKAHFQTQHQAPVPGPVAGVRALDRRRDQARLDDPGTPGSIGP